MLKQYYLNQIVKIYALLLQILLDGDKVLLS